MRRVLLVLLGLLIGIPALYVGVAFALAVLTPKLELPRGEGITVYACDNGVHTDLVLPISAEGIDWRQLPHPSQSARAGLSHISIGWGSRDFYINTPTWADVESRRRLKSVLWDETVLHVEYRPRTRSGRNIAACWPWSAQ